MLKKNPSHLSVAFSQQSKTNQPVHKKCTHAYIESLQVIRNWKVHTLLNKTKSVFMKAQVSNFVAEKKKKRYFAKPSSL